MLIGTRSVGVNQNNPVADRLLATTTGVPVWKDARAVKATVLLAGAAADGLVKAVLYRDNFLAAVSDEAVIPANAPAAWLDFPFVTEALPEGVLFEQGAVLDLALHVGAQVFVWHATTDGVTATIDTYSDGPPAFFAGVQSNSISAFVTLVPVFSPRATATEQTLARMAFPEAQVVLGATSPVDRGVQAACGWHGTVVDANRGSFAVVREDGPLAGLVGQRVVLTTQSAAVTRKAYAYVVASSGRVVEDISVTRRLFLELAPLASDEVSVRVQVLAGAAS